MPSYIMFQRVINTCKLLCRSIVSVMKRTITTAIAAIAITIATAIAVVITITENKRYRGYYIPACGYDWIRALTLRYRVEHSKIKFISTSGHVILCLVYKHTNNDFFWRFSEDFRPLSEDFPKLFRRLVERF